MNKWINNSNLKKELVTTWSNSNFEKKMSSNEFIEKSNHDQFQAKYKKKINKSRGIASSASSNNIDPFQSNLITSIKSKNSRNNDRLIEKAIINTNNKNELKVGNNHQLISSENIKWDNLIQNMSFDFLEKQRILRQK